VNLQLSKVIICVTKGIKRELIKRYGVNESKIVVIPNGANTELFQPLDKWECRHKLGLDNHAFYVGFVVGDGEQERYLKEKVKEYGLEKEVIFTGRVNYDEVVYYINAFDVAVAPFTKERNVIIGLSPLKLYEYLACAKPVIASRIDGVTEVIEEGQCGYLFGIGNAKELANIIIQSYYKLDKLKGLGESGRKLIESKYSWGIIVQKVVKVLDEVTKNRG